MRTYNVKRATIPYIMILNKRFLLSCTILILFEIIVPEKKETDLMLHEYNCGERPCVTRMNENA